MRRSTIHRASARRLPLLVFESLDCSDPYACDRRHTFLLEGVADTASRLQRLGAGYRFHLARRKGAEGYLDHGARQFHEHPSVQREGASCTMRTR